MSELELSEGEAVHRKSICEVLLSVARLGGDLWTISEIAQELGCLNEFEQHLASRPAVNYREIIVTIGKNVKHSTVD